MSLLRKLEEGWEPLAMHDPPGRRGLWMRETGEANDVATIELCSGREGDDAEVTIRAGEVMTPERMYQLRQVLDYARWAYELGIAGGVTLAELHQRLRALEPCPVAPFGAHFWTAAGDGEESCSCGTWRAVEATRTPTAGGDEGGG